MTKSFTERAATAAAVKKREQCIIVAARIRLPIAPRPTRPPLLLHTTTHMQLEHPFFLLLSPHYLLMPFAAARKETHLTTTEDHLPIIGALMIPWNLPRGGGAMRRRLLAEEEEANAAAAATSSTSMTTRLEDHFGHRLRLRYPSTSWCLSLQEEPS